MDIQTERREYIRLTFSVSIVDLDSTAGVQLVDIVRSENGMKRVILRAAEEACQ